MKIIGKVEKFFNDDKSISRVDGNKNKLDDTSCRSTGLLLCSTPLWPTSGKVRKTDRPKVLNVCGTVPAYFHKYSRQGEQPAKGEIPEFWLSDYFLLNPVMPYDRGCLCKKNGKKIVHVRMIGSRQKGDSIFIAPLSDDGWSGHPKRPHFFSGVLTTNQ